MPVMKPMKQVMDEIMEKYFGKGAVAIAVEI
jgi:hypothetical protein